MNYISLIDLAVQQSPRTEIKLSNSLSILPLDKEEFQQTLWRLNSEEFIERFLMKKFIMSALESGKLDESSVLKFIESKDTTDKNPSKFILPRSYQG